MSELLVVGDIRTLDSTGSRAEAVALRDGRVVAVGDRRSATATLSATAPVLDAPGPVVPGFVDTHVHVQWLGRRLSRVVLDDASSIADLQRRLRTAAAEGTGWVEGDAGFSTADLAERRLPTADELEAAVPGRPVLLDRKGHDALANRTALRIAGLPEQHNGQLVEHAAVDVVRRHVPAADRSTRQAWVVAGTAALRRAGITTAVDPAVPVAELDAWTTAYDAAGLQTRVGLMPLGGADVDPAELVARADEALADRDPRWIWRGPTKLFLDGGGSLGTALRSRPWPHSGSSGEQSTPTEVLEAYARHAADTGTGLGVHAVGDRAVDLAVDVAVAAGAGHLLQLIHAYLGPSPRAMALASAHGAVVSAHPALQWLVGPDLVALLGLDEAASANPLRRWSDAGVRVAGGSDAPGPDPAPLHGIWQARTRRVRGREIPLGPDQALSAEEALRLFTPQPITPGAPGDLTVLDTDPVHPNPEALREARVLATVLGDTPDVQEY